jgi:hypothetical protein
MCKKDTPCTFKLQAFERDILHVRTAGSVDGYRYTPDVHAADGGEGYALEFHTSVYIKLIL